MGDYSRLVGFEMRREDAKEREENSKASFFALLCGFAAS